MRGAGLGAAKGTNSLKAGVGTLAAFSDGVLAMDTKPVLTKEDDVWVIRLENPGSGKVQEYRCATEAQARQLALVLTPKEKR